MRKFVLVPAAEERLLRSLRPVIVLVGGFFQGRLGLGSGWVLLRPRALERSGMLRLWFCSRIWERDVDAGAGLGRVLVGCQDWLVV